MTSTTTDGTLGAGGPTVELEVTSADDGIRLDRFVAREGDVPRNQVQRWIRDGHVRLASGAAKVSAALATGDVVSITPPAPPPVGIEPEAGDLEIVFEDQHLVVVDKPAGLVVHPGAGHRDGTLAHRLLHRYPETAAVGGPGRPGIVHRLDKDTSGLMVVARTQAGYRGLSRAFAARSVEKTYQAIVYGVPAPATGQVDRPIGRHPRHRTMMAVRPDGRPAVTGYRTLASLGGLSLLELDLHTGRTHQIRVHMKAFGHPLLGDPVYGEERWRGLPTVWKGYARSAERPLLHAWKLRFAHPVDGTHHDFEALPPPDFERLASRLLRYAAEAGGPS